MNRKTIVIVSLLLTPFLLWGAIFATNRALGSRIGFDYDDTIAFSSPSFDSAEEKHSGGMSVRNVNWKAYWTEVNADPSRDYPKPTTLNIARWARLLGIRPVIITARPAFGKEPFIAYWGDEFDEIYFTREKSRVLGRDFYLAFLGDSDSDIDEALEAGVTPVRILRSEKSGNKGKNDPGSRGEWIVPGSDAHETP